MPIQRRQFKPVRKARGLSLIELMVALALGLLVIAAMIQLFAGNRATFSANEALARVQENGRFGLETLRREVRAVNFYGTCAAKIPIRNHLRTDCGSDITTIFDDDRAIVGWEFLGTGLGETYDALAEESDLEPSAGGLNRWRSRAGAVNLDLPDFLNNRVVPGSDVLLIRTPEVVAGVTADGNTPANADSINLNTNHGLEKDEIVLITNCATGADLFQNQSNSNASSLSAGSGSCSNPGPGNINNLNWSTAYDDTMQIFRIRIQAFYIGYNATTNEPGLYRANLGLGTVSSNVVHEELVGGIESMQVLYGYSLPADQGGNGQTVDFWITADQVPDWDFVIVARIALLVRSSENMGAGALRRTFDLAGTAFTHPEDGRLRQPFFSSISLRNQQLVL